LPTATPRSLSPRAATRTLTDRRSAHAEPDAQRSGSQDALTSGRISGKRRDDEGIREAALFTFLDPLPNQCSLLLDLSQREWNRLLRWLDISGLALYFLDRIVSLRITDWLPRTVFERLQQNLFDNTRRTESMIAESTAIQAGFQAATLSYANLKGLSYWPASVPNPVLRSQFDLDFLVAEASAPAAREILERRGYRLYAVSGRSWEFKLNAEPWIPLKNLYKDTPSRAVELHLESANAAQPLLERIEWRELAGISMPVLSPVDLFLGQGLHVYKHVCGEFFRVAHLLEFRRHVLARYNDVNFWSELRAVAYDSPRARLGLGVVILLLTHVMGEFAPAELTEWTVQSLPDTARLWITMYGRRAVLGSFPGSKFYLLLQRELQASGVATKRSVRESLLPARLPPPVTRAARDERPFLRVRRHLVQLHFVFSRLRFHFVEGVRYIWQSHRWQKQLNRIAR